MTVVVVDEPVMVPRNREPSWSWSWWLWLHRVGEESMDEDVGDVVPSSVTSLVAYE